MSTPERATSSRVSDSLRLALAVPDVLRSGDHGRIARWRRAAALRRTLERRPDLLDRRGLTEEERAMLEEGSPQ